MSWHLVRWGDVAPSQWRNGGGVTRELASWPGPEDWIWRISVAEVGRSGPFSRFEGVQRWFAVLGGAGVRLSVGAQTHELTCRSAPLSFDGAAPADCELLDGATQDFNLMLRQGRATAQMQRLSENLSLTLDAPKTIAVYAIDTVATARFDESTVKIPAYSLAWQALPAGTALQLGGANALWMEIAPCA